MTSQVLCKMTDWYFKDDTTLNVDLQHIEKDKMRKIQQTHNKPIPTNRLTYKNNIFLKSQPSLQHTFIL